LEQTLISEKPLPKTDGYDNLSVSSPVFRIAKTVSFDLPNPTLPKSSNVTDAFNRGPGPMIAKGIEFRLTQVLLSASHILILQWLDNVFGINQLYTLNDAGIFSAMVFHLLPLSVE
jgi:hypothetical protein